MNTAEFVKELTKRTKANRSTVEKIVEEGMELIKDILIEDEKLNLKRFGTFKMKHREARLANNPRTGEKIQVPARSVPHFAFTLVAKRDIEEGQKI